MMLPAARGSLSETVRERLLEGAPIRPPGDLPEAEELADLCLDDDLQLALAMAYELHYRGFDDVDDDLEWDADLLAFRAALERRLERAVRRACADALAACDGDTVDVALRRLVDSDQGPALSRWLMRHGTWDDFALFLAQRSVYNLREADAHTFAIPRLHGRAKAALVEIQSDEYGGGRPAAMHSTLFAASMRELGLDDTYGAHWERATGPALAVVNVMSLFGLHRRLRGALAGHLAALEMTSTLPNRRVPPSRRCVTTWSSARPPVWLSTECSRRT
jgi:hypothetical protein